MGCRQSRLGVAAGGLARRGLDEDWQPLRPAVPEVSLLGRPESLNCALRCPRARTTLRRPAEKAVTWLGLHADGPAPVPSTEVTGGRRRPRQRPPATHPGEPDTSRLP